MFLIFLTFLLNLYAVTPCHNAFEIVTGVADVATGTPLAREEIHKLLEEDFKKDVVNAGYQILNSNFASGGHATQMLVEKNGKKYLFKRLNKDIHEADKFLKNEYKMARRAYESEPGPKHHFANVEKIKINGEEVLRSEFILGETLYLKMVGHLSEEDKLKIAKQLITAVQHAHDVGVIHRDLKPANIYVDNNNNVYLLDFGIAALKGGFPEIGETAKNLGTLQQAL
jgi:serine/threonine protein kinase